MIGWLRAACNVWEQQPGRVFAVSTGFAIGLAEVLVGDVTAGLTLALVTGLWGKS